MQHPEAGHQTIVILDFGSQYSHLIARRLRECGVFSELLSCETSAEDIAARAPRGIILSGGPNSVYEADSPHASSGIWALGLPVLGICYGMQEMCHTLGGSVIPGTHKEYGKAELNLTVAAAADCPLFSGLPSSFTVWMSHGDKVGSLGAGFQDVATTASTEHAAINDKTRNLYGIQFHPEVTHTTHGTIILKNFAFKVCGCTGDWTMGSFLDEAIANIREVVGDGTVIGAVSGGVDSTVGATLLHKAIGDRFHGFFVDSGLLRLGEQDEVMVRLRDTLGINLKIVDASEDFLRELNGVEDPEQKRKIIGRMFIEEFDKHAKVLDAGFLLQGTLYPDVIESLSHRGPSATIKSHHNVGGLPAHMKLKLIEPLRFLFKDEVRHLGEVLGLAHEHLYRHPFPGPGLAIRILGAVDKTSLDTLRLADNIFITELRKAGVYDKVGQAFVVLLPCRSVGVMGDGRTYEKVCALRAVETTDYMTADWYPLPYDLLRTVSSRIINEVPGINRVTYDISSKPPSTIEWE
mmetsp:Transcript_9404/g.21464  ORF Transcript_9404/g.21464 Transcript_9404/m.21464 type:complete len:521 (+) Transcript_9404:78-1640(+)|eukprot:CAMPEP_0114554216 /NCGR_PEP_ID=MMETSP0114-20121206/8093_1 /TAXON_ID=31324 /ORGANISM="Goniomonas sp, Strain m" /LENGTH=520 /DNA_ID=CAMNT_0001739251 /DNA_START=78 /DNA_END=1640 /DNA_ORIENTATION=-